MQPAGCAIVRSVRTLLLVAIAISSWFVTAARASGAESSVLPSDAELKKWIVGTWRIDYPGMQSTSRFAYEIYRENGTFKHVQEGQEANARPRLLFDLSGTWSVENGYLVTRITAGNTSTMIGRTARDKIESANRDWFILREDGNSRTRRRAALPPGFGSSPAEVPKVFTVEEAAQVLRRAKKPDYSYEARRTRTTGSGMFELRFDYDTGRLKAIDIVQSTGSRLLDHDAIDGLKEWRAKPHTIRVMRIPITFTIR